MSAILSADDLNDFISPGVACIKPVETLPLQNPSENVYEVTTEDKVAAQAPPAQISLTDCLACSGCVTSAEAVLISLQSHAEVLNALDSAPMISPDFIQEHNSATFANRKYPEDEQQGKIFVASVSPQVRASLAATYGTSEKEAGWMIEQLFGGTQGLGAGGRYGNRFAWTVDTNAMREACLVLESEDLKRSLGNDSIVKRPVLTSACPGWICYAEKTHPHVIPHLSKLKSPQALTGTLLKSVLSRQLGVKPSQVWHLAVMPCFDKKLEASRAELTDTYWSQLDENAVLTPEASRDVDCVITAREILMLADARGISFPLLPKEPLQKSLQISFPDSRLAEYIFSYRPNTDLLSRNSDANLTGTSGGYLYHILCTQQALHPGSKIMSDRGRNADVIDYRVVLDETTVFKAARYYGFRNIQNLVRKLKPTKFHRLPNGKLGGTRKANTARDHRTENSYVEVMACPGGCTNGGGQIKLDDLSELQAKDHGVSNPKDWLSIVDETYYSMEEDATIQKKAKQDGVLVNGINMHEVKALLEYWAEIVGISLNTLTHTTFRVVQSDVGKPKQADTEHVIEIASKIGGGW